MVAAVRNEPQLMNDKRYRLGTWVLLAAVIMLFTSLTSAYIVRAASSNDWQKVPMPRILIASTAIILLSSLTLEAARRKLNRALSSGYFRWLVLTAVLGLAFLGTQLLAWRQLVGQGIRLATNPHASFFYLLAAVHGLHLAGGLVVLAYLITRSRRADELVRPHIKAASGAASLYWHFMDGLWIYLFLLLFFWR
jgi:cytochrome c oxidase subunit III